MNILKEQLEILQAETEALATKTAQFEREVRASLAGATSEQRLQILQRLDELQAENNTLISRRKKLEEELQAQYRKVLS